MAIQIKGSGDIKKHFSDLTKKIEEKVKTNTKLAEDKATKAARIFLDEKAKENGLDPATMTEQDLENLKTKYGHELRKIGMDALRSSF